MKEPITGWWDVEIHLDHVAVDFWYPIPENVKDSYVAVACADGEDPLEILTRGGPAHDLLLGKRCTTRVSSHGSNTPGQLTRQLIPFGETLQIVSALYHDNGDLGPSSNPVPPTVARTGTRSKIALWFFRFRFSGDALNETQIRTSSDDDGTLSVPVNPTALFPVTYGRLENKMVISRQTPRVALLGFCLLISKPDGIPALEQGSPKSVPLVPGTLLLETMQAPHTLGVLQAPFLISRGTSLGAVRCAIAFRRSAERETLHSQWLSVTKQSFLPRSLPVALVRGVFLTLVRVSRVPMSQLLPELHRLVAHDSFSSTATLKNVFRRLCKPHKLVLRWAHTAEAQPSRTLRGVKGLCAKIAQTTGALNPSRLGVTTEESPRQLSTSEPPGWGSRVIWSHPQVELSAFSGAPEKWSDMGASCGVEFILNQKVWMMLPRNATRRLTCTFTIMPDLQNLPRDDTILQGLEKEIRLNSNSIDLQAVHHGGLIDIALCTQDGQCKRAAGALRLAVKPYPSGPAVWLQPGTQWDIDAPSSSSADTSDAVDFFAAPPPLGYEHTSLQCLLSKTTTETSAHIIQRDLYFSECPANLPASSMAEKRVADAQNLSHAPFTPILSNMVWIASGNPASIQVAGKKYLLELTTAPLITPTSPVVDRDCWTEFQQTPTLPPLAENLSLSLMTVPEGVVSFSVSDDSLGPRESCAGSLVPSACPNLLEWGVSDFNTFPVSTATVWYRLHGKGRFSLSILLGGSHIAGSPFDIRVISDVPDPMATRVYTGGEGLWACHLGGSVPCLGSLEGGPNSLDAVSYDNIIKVCLFDHNSVALETGGHLVAARAASSNLRIQRVIDGGDGTYTVVFWVLCNVRSAHSGAAQPTPPTALLEIFLDSVPIAGSPLAFDVTNIEELSQLAFKKSQGKNCRSIVEAAKQLLSENRIEDVQFLIEENQKAHNAQRALSKTRLDAAISNMRDKQKAAQQLLEVIHGSLWNTTPSVQDIIHSLQNRWQAAAELKRQLKAFFADEAHRDTTNIQLESIWRQFSTHLAARTEALASQTEAVTRLLDLALLPLEARLNTESQALQEALSQDLVFLFREIQQNHFKSVEELESLHVHLANELRKLHRPELADRVDKLTQLTLAEIDLRWQRHIVQWRQEKLDKLESILIAKELNLQFVENNFKESVRQNSVGQAKAHKSTSASPVLSPPNDERGWAQETPWEIPPLADDKEIQTEDPLSYLASKFGPLVVYRATGMSPCASVPKEPDAVRRLARGSSMGEALQRLWKPPRNGEILHIRKLLKSCPRTRSALDEIFYTFTVSEPKDGVIARKKNYPTPGLTWESFKRFCLRLSLSPVLLNDVTALRHLFQKFSVQYKLSMSSSLGFTRVIPHSLWIAFVRELGHLNTLAAVIEHGDPPVAPLHRASTFLFFIRCHILPLYDALEPSTYITHDTTAADSKPVAEASRTGPVLPSQLPFREDLVTPRLISRAMEFLAPDKLKEEFLKIHQQYLKDDSRLATPSPQDTIPRISAEAILHYLRRDLHFIPNHLPYDRCEALLRSHFHLNEAPLKDQPSLRTHTVTLLEFHNFMAEVFAAGVRFMMDEKHLGQRCAESHLGLFRPTSDFQPHTVELYSLQLSDLISAMGLHV